MTETRYQRVAREQAERQHARATRLLEESRPRRKRSIARYTEHLHRAQQQADYEHRRNADRIDGFDRDDLGESPDF